MIIKKIPPSQWHKIEKTFTDVFDSDMPDKKNGTFYGYYENGKLEAFVLTEKIIIVGQIYSYKDKNNGHAIKKLVDYITDLLPKGTSVGAVASETRFEGLFRLLKMQKITGTFFRRDL